MISFAASVPYRDKGTIMMGFKDWLTQISGAICHAPTGRPREPPLPLPSPRVCTSPYTQPWSLFTPFVGRFLRPPSVIGARDPSFLSVRQTPLNSKVNCEIGILARARVLRIRSSTLSGPDKLSAPDDSITSLLASEQFNKIPAESCFEITHP